MEEWRDIAGYEGYQVSNLGRVRSLDRWIVDKNGLRKKRKGQIIKLLPIPQGYYYVGLSNGKKARVNRLVAEAFIPNPDNLPCVNHKNENMKDNRVENLEWCSYSYNLTYGTIRERIRTKTINGKNSKPVLQYDKQGKFIKEYPSINEVKRQLGYDAGTICKCCQNKEYFHTAYGYIWKYKKVA